MENRLYVGNLSYDMTEMELRDLFGQAGAVRDVSLITERETGRPRGFAFVEMETQADAENAIRMFNDKEMNNRKLVVNMARPRENAGGGGGSFQGGSGGFRGGGGGGRGRDSRGGRGGGRGRF